MRRRCHLTLLLLAAALLLPPCRAVELQAEDEERLPGWLGEVSRDGSGAGAGGLLRGGATSKASTAKQARNAADAQRSRVARLPADGIPVPGTVHPEARGRTARAAAALACGA